MHFSELQQKLERNPDYEVFHYETVAEWERDLIQTRPIEQHMVDIWADANALVNKFQTDPDPKKIQQLLKVFHRKCGVLYQAYEGNSDLKRECKLHEWLLDNYVSGNNELRKTDKNIMEWFDKFYAC